MRFRKAIKAVSHFIVLFLIVAFVVTCCMMLFVSTMQNAMNYTFTEENIALAAKLTMINVLLLTLLLSLVELVRHKILVDRPIQKITRASEQLMQGDFSVRIEPDRHDSAQFAEVIDSLNRIAQELGSLETLRADFIANVSHEMKTPLAVMQNYATLLKQPGVTQQQRLEYAAVIENVARRMASMITNILKLNRLENQQIYPKCVAFDLSDQLCRCLLQFEQEWEEKNIAIITEIEDGITILSDEELLSLVWNNLLSNAFKFTEPGGSVSLKLTTTEQHVIVEVEDTGCGMSGDVGRHIFEKFYQGDTSHATRGNGLGLALVRRVIDILHCSIDVESVVGQGSVFTVKIRRN